MARRYLTEEEKEREQYKIGSKYYGVPYDEQVALREQAENPYIVVKRNLTEAEKEEQRHKIPAKDYVAPQEESESNSYWDKLRGIDESTVKKALGVSGTAAGLGTAAAVAGSGLALPLAAAGLATVGLKKFNETEAGKAVNNKIKEWSDASYEKKYTIEDRVADLMKEEPAMTEAEAVDIAKGEGFRDSRGTYAPKNEDGTAMNTLEYIEKEGKQKFGISDEELDMAKKVVYSQMSDKVRTNQANGGRVEKERYEKLAGGYEGIDEFNQYLDDLGQTGEGRTKRSVLMQYAKAMVNSELADKEREELTNAVNDNGNDKRNGFAKAVNDVGLDAVSVGMNLVGGVSNAIGNATSAIRLGDRSMPTDVNNRLGRFSQQAQDIRNARTEEIGNYFNNETVGNIAKFGYGATMSAVDSGVAALTGSEALTLGIMASNSYDSALKEAQDKGLTEEQSRDLAFVSGVTEILTEKIGLDNLYSMSKKPIKSVLKETLIQAGFEGSEEVAGDIINEIADRIIAGDRSEYEKAKAEGMSDAEYIKQFAMQLGLDFVAGAWGGALHGGVVAGNQMIKSGKNYKNKGDIANNQKSLEVMDDIAKVNEAVGQKYAEVKEFGDKLAAKEAAGQKVTLDEKATYDAKQSELFQTLNEEGITYKDVEEGRKTKIETPEEFKVNNTNKLNSEDAYRSMANATTPAELVEAYEMSDKSEVNTGAYKNFKSRMLNNGYDVAQFDTAERITNTEDAYKQGYVDAENGMFNQSNALTGKTQIAYNQGVIDARTKQAENTLKSEGEFTPKVTVGGKEANIDIQSDPITFKGDTAVVNVNGNEVKPTDIEFANETTAKLFTYAASMDNEATANAALKFYPGNMSVDMYKRAFSYAHNQGMLNVPFENIVKNKPFFVDALGEKNIKAIYEIGKEATKDEKPSSKEVKSVARKGTGKVEYDLTNKKIGKSQTALIEFLAKKMSVDVTVTDDNVKSMGANGFFNAVTGKVVLNVNKGNMFGTLFHEIAGEYAEAFNSKEMVAFQNDLLNWYYTVMNPQSLESIIKNYQSVYQNSGHNNQSNKTFREAADEMLNDALAGLFENERTMDKFASWLIDENGVEEATKEINTFADLVKKIADSIRSLALGSKKNIGQMMLSNTKDADKLMDQFLKVLDGAIANYNNIEVSDSANSQEQFSVDIESAKPGTEILDKDGNLAAIVGENGEVAFSLNTSDYTKGVLNKYLDKMVKSGQLSKQDADDIISSYEVIEDYTRELVESGDYEEFSDWQMEDAFTDDAKALTCIVKNGEYPLNLDWSTICKKRLPFNTVMSRLVKMSDFNVAGLSPQDIVEINDIIKNRGFEVACKLCFVESRRYNTPSWARSFVNPWNALVDAAANGEKVGELDFRNADYSNLSSFTPNWKAVEKKALELSEEAGFKPTKNHPSPIKPIYEKMIRLMKSDSKALNHLNTNDFINSEGMDRMLNDYKKLYKIVFGHGGQSKPKIVHSESRYRSEILKGRSFSKAKSDYIGGVRLQSFSDFRANLYFDYVQAYSELAAKSLRLQSYSKEPAYAKLFGLTGAKINMSLLGNVDSKTKEQIDKAFPDGFGGADKETNELLRRVGLDANGNYVQNDESFPWEEAFKLQSNDEYSKNVGTILVGLSYEHIKKAMDDDQIRMVIPYHASGIPGAVASRTNVAYYTDYTQYQHEKQLVGDKKYKFNYYIALEECEKLAKKGKFAWDDVPKKAAEMLVRECEKNGYAPRFPQFAYNITDGSTTVTYKNGMPDNVEKDSNNVPLINKNYYKLIEDFTMYDNNGHYAPQKEVRMNFPTTINSGVEVKSVGMDGKELSFKEYLGAIIDDQHKSNAMLTDNMQDMIDEIMEKLNDSESESVVFSLDVDTLGNTLSSEQKEYFKDSKVVDSNGALKVMYHGTPNSGFTVFDPTKAEDGASLFFTDKKSVARTYSNSVVKGNGVPKNVEDANNLLKNIDDALNLNYNYSDIFSFSKEGKQVVLTDSETNKVHKFDTLAEAWKYFRNNEYVEDDAAVDGAGNYEVYLNVVNPLVVNGTGNYFNEVEYNGKKYTTRELSQYAKDNGYDGVIINDLYDNGEFEDYSDGENSTVVIAFNSNQVKNIDNLKPTDNADIRFSLDVDSLGNELSEGQKEYFKDSKIVDENGALKVMYHGTPNSGFTVFDPKESDDMLSLFFTDNKDVADSYSGSGDSDLKPIFSNYNGSEREANADFYNRLWDSGNDSYAYEYGVRKNKGRWEIVGLRYENKDNYEDDEDVSYSDYLKKYHSADALFSANSYLELLKKFEDEVVHTPLAVGNYAVYLNVTNPLHVYNPSGKNMMWYDTTGFSSNHADYENTIRNGASKSELENEKHTTRDWAEKAFNEGYDGVIFHNIYDIGNNSNQWNNEASTVVVAFNSNQIKLVDNLKPTDNADIRFSIDNDFWDAMDMSEEEAALIFGEEYVNTTEEVASIIEEGAKSLEKVKVDRQLVENIAKRIVRSHQSTYSPTTLADNLEKLFAYFDELGGTVNYIDIQRIASEIARPVVMDSTVTDDVATQMYKDFRDVVRSYPIKLTEDQKNEIKGLGISLKGFGFGMLNLSSEGSYTDDIWSELQDRAREIGYILPDATDLDQPLALLDALEGLKNSQTRTLDENGMGIDEESKALGMEIIKDYFQAQNGGATNQTVEELKKAISDYKNNVESIYADRLERAKKELEDAIKKDKEKLKDAKDTIKYQKELIAIYKTNASIRSRYEHKEALTKGRATDRVKKVANKLITMLTSPTDKKHVPDVLRKPVAEFLDTIDFVSHRASAESKESAKWQDKMNDLSRLLGKIKSLEEEDTDGVVSNLSEALDEDLIDSMELFVKNYGNKSSLSRLDGEGTKELARILEGLYTQINNTNKLYENRYNQDAISLCIMSHVELAEMKERVDKTGVGKVLKNFFNADLLDSISYFNALGKHANSILDELKEGYKHKYRRVNQTQKWFNNMLKELKINDKVLKNWTGKHANATTFKLAEGDITLTTGQIMSLYNHLQREQSREHIFVGGIKASLEEGKGRHQAQIKPIHAKSNELQMIIDTLTDDQKAVAQKMQWYLSNVCSSWGNNVTKKAYGYTKFTEEHYWPIKSNSNSIATNDKNTNDTVAMRGLEHSGCTKNLTPHSTNAIEIRDAFDVFTEHSVFMASYEGLVLPIKDALKWFNYSPKTVGADQDDIDNPYGQRRYEISIKEDIERIMGTRGQKWFVKFMRDINGDAKGSGTVELISKFSGFMKASSVGGNLRVAIQQPTAYVRALNVLPPSTLVEAMAVNPFKYSEKAKSKSSWAWIKGEGYYDTFLGKSMKEIITNQATTTDKVKDYMNILSQYGDDLTWGVLYHAAEIQVKKDNKGIDVNSKEFTEKVVELFDSVIDQTQVVDTVFHRSDLMRHKEADMLTAFMMEPSKSYNMIYRALGSGDKKKIARALLTFVLNAIFVSAAAGLVDRMRNDDNEHSGMDIYLQAVIGRDPETGKIPVGDFLQSNLGDNLNPLNIVPVFKEIVSAFEGYDPSRMDVSVIYDSVKSSKKIYSNLEKLAAGDEMQKTPYGMYYECAKVISEMTGIPISSASRDIVGIYNTINNNWDGKNISKDNEYYKNGSQYGSFDRAFDNGDFETVKTFINNKKAEDPDDLPNVTKHLTSTYKPKLIELKEQGKTDEYNQLYNRLVECYVLTNSGKRDKTDAEKRKSAKEKIADWFE